MSLPRSSLVSAALLAAGLALGPGIAQAQTRTVNINDVTVTEGQTATFTVSLSSPSNRRIRVEYRTENGTAVAPGDYTARSGRLEFNPGVTSRTVQITTINDTLAENTENFQVRLREPDRVQIGDGTGVGTILDNDQQNPTISINDVQVTEGGTANFNVTLSRTSTQTVTVVASTANGSAVGSATPNQGDFTTRTQTLTFNPGTTSQTFAVTTINDTLVEQTEAFQVNLTSPTNATIADAQGIGTILDNDGNVNTPPTCRIDLPTENTVTVARGGTVNYAGTVTDPNTGQVITITWAFPGGTPGTSNLEDPGLVRYNTAGTFTTTLSATDNGTPPLTCVQQIKTVVVTDQPLPPVSINSTSENCGGPGQVTCSNNPAQPGFQQPAPGATGSGLANFRVLAVNDLGMHCGDLDTRVASILPPFNVLRAQVFQQPATGRVPTRNPAGVTVNYSAASNPNDPALAVAPTLVPNTGGVFKTNFWDIATRAYDAFYPPAPSNPFLAPFNLTMPVDQGLPVPDVELLYINAGPLEFNQQAMPGIGNAYRANNPQNFILQVATQPFFTTFPFGYRSNVNWYTAEGVPISVFDDFGRENPYPLMRVQARNAQNQIVATTDTVMPVSAEADCQICHGAPVDGGNGTATAALGANVADHFDDPQLGTVPTAASIEWASDNNILRLHDLRHQTNLLNSQPVVCQTCHYTPALDLAQVGPNDVNGRQQSNNQSMSRVIHNHHGTLPGNLFPTMPAPVQDANGVITNQTARLAVVDQTCYRCHPGDRTQCLRGAMFNGGMLCQDCHGNMTDVGNDFSRNQPGGGFTVLGDFYTNPTTPRIPWANEPGCGSCHTGDASSSLANTAGTITNLRDNRNNVDNIRLLQAFRSTDVNKKPIVPTNKRFAENVITPGATTAPGLNPKLYRVSVDNHGAANGGGAGIFCEACHGATHAEWPNANPNANDNVTANQLQGHTGVIIECSTCHGASLNSFNTLDGPHGMHPVGNDTSVTTGSAIGPLISFVDGGHSNMTGGNACVACHGTNATSGGRGQNQGTVLSVAKKDRRLNGQTIPAGTPIGCTICH